MAGPAGFGQADEPGGVGQPAEPHRDQEVLPPRLSPPQPGQAEPAEEDGDEQNGRDPAGRVSDFGQDEELIPEEFRAGVDLQADAAAVIENKGQSLLSVAQVEVEIGQAGQDNQMNQFPNDDQRGCPQAEPNQFTEADLTGRIIDGDATGRSLGRA